MDVKVKVRRFACVVSLGVVLVLCGCVGISPSTLQPADTSKALRIMTDFSFDAYYSISGIRWRMTLASGRYVAHKQDASGVYYLGPKQCMSQTLVEAGWGERESRIGKTLASVDCLIYYPNDVGQEPKVFVLVGSWQNYPDGKAPIPSAAYGDAVLPIAMAAVPTATPLQAGAGAAIGGAIVDALVAAERENYAQYQRQPSGGDLRRALQIAD